LNNGNVSINLWLNFNTSSGVFNSAYLSNVNILEFRILDWLLYLFPLLQFYYLIKLHSEVLWTCPWVRTILKKKIRNSQKCSNYVNLLHYDMNLHNIFNQSWSNDQSVYIKCITCFFCNLDFSRIWSLTWSLEGKTWQQ
jgi:hypothetical protein